MELDCPGQEGSMQGLGELVKAPSDFIEPESEQARERQGSRLMDKARQRMGHSDCTEAEPSNGPALACVLGR